MRTLVTDRRNLKNGDMITITTSGRFTPSYSIGVVAKKWWDRKERTVKFELHDFNGNLLVKKVYAPNYEPNGYYSTLHKIDEAEAVLFKIKHNL